MHPPRTVGSLLTKSESIRGTICCRTHWNSVYSNAYKYPSHGDVESENGMARSQSRASSGRYVSRLTSGALAVVMAGGRGERLKDLTLHRCKPATPFGGKFRIIDFVLSNCVNSGIRQIFLMTQYKGQSLIQHVQRGWSYLRGEFGEFIDVVPAQQQVGQVWYRGTAD